MIVTILRALPGTGKTRWALERAIEAAHRKQSPPIIYSADDYFTRSGRYEFDPRDIGIAHAECFRQYIDHLMWKLTLSSRHAIIDNTNLSTWEISPYVLAANAFKADVRIVTLVCDPEVAFARQTHGVPR
jgi:hypothetical protein